MFEGIFLEFANYLISFGYLGIFLLMTIESSFIPFPSELVMIPAGYFASLGTLNIYLVIFLGILGSLVGALINYFIADRFGRDLLHKNAKKLFTTKENLEKMEMFFKKHGSFSTFFGRLIPVVRQYISFPAGLSKMDLSKFVFYTSLGAGIWVTILSVLGYLFGSQKELIFNNLKIITYILLIVGILSAVIYFFYIYRKKLFCKK